VIFRRALLREFAHLAAAVFAALFSIAIVVTLVNVLGRAAGGRLPVEAVIATVGFSALNALPLILGGAMFVSVLLALSRSYRDAEMVIWFSSGLSLMGWVRPVLAFATPFVVLIAGLTLWLTPWANLRMDEYRTQLASREETSRIAPGVFLESPRADRVFFVESFSEEEKRVENVFVSFRQRDRQGVMVARSGRIETTPAGDRYAVLLDGRRYEGVAGTPEYRVMTFTRYEILIEQSAATPTRVSLRGLDLPALVADSSNEARAELLWRIGQPLVALVLALLALPLAFVNPRARTSLNLVFAVLTYMVYTNLLSVAQAQVAQGKLAFAIGCWLVHACMLGVFALLMAWRMRLIDPRSWRRAWRRRVHPGGVAA
jgi:lipopolysaccharide export system permease protein